MKRRAKRLFAACGVLLASYVAVYFIRSETSTFQLEEKTTIRYFPTWIEFRIYAPVLWIEERIRSEAFVGAQGGWEPN